MTFAHPEAFLLFLPLLAAMFFTWKYGVRFRARIFYPSSHWVDGRPRSTIPTPFKIHFFLRTLALAFLIVGIARPQHVFNKIKRYVESVDMILCFDLSKSMLALDFEPNRRVVAINTITNFIDKRPDDRIGLVLFSGEAYLAMPVTQDHEMLKEAVAKSSNRHIKDGTAIGQSLALAVHHLHNSTAKSRVIILVTDGDNNMGSVDPRTAAALAEGYGIRVYTIGLGREGRVAFPDRGFDRFGNEVEVMRYLTNAVDEVLLADIASRTGGRYFRAAEGNVLEQVFSNIDQLEKTEVETQKFQRKTELAWPWILTGLLLLLLELIALNTRWRKLP